MNFWQVPEQHAHARPDALALRFQGQDISHAQLAARSARVAALLWHDWGVRTGERVAWLGLNHPGQLVLLFALARIGAMLLPLNVRLAPAEWEGQLRDCRPTHLVHGPEWAAQAQQLGARCALAVHPLDALDQETAHAAPRIGAPGTDALLVYTSGTTGQPRAAVHTQANLLANMRIAAQVQQITDGDLVLTVLPLFHVGGLCIQTLPALYAGAGVSLQPRFSADATLDALAQQRPTLTLQVPATMKALVDHPRWPEADLSCLRAVWAGSSVLPAPLVQAFLDRGVALCNVYGSTETGPFSIALPPAAARSHAGSCGWPAPGVEAMLAGVQQGCGEVLLRGPNVVARYWPDQPACDDDGWFHTGDLATRAEDGSYTVIGRSKDLIISGGENIHPLEVEAAVAQHPAVAECAAFGLPDPRWGEAVAVAIVLRADAQLAPGALAQHLDGRLARFKCPRRVFFVAALPKTALGKLQRQALASLAGEPDPA
ncbi:class I adenylate-forming enzyme family protein [Caenimonas terrae]|uniref:Class I adenylate-forming enzyme family protein n=1 Tax=Caenimonas terrae TaxID=696074 RepID=A0ABW0N892_9BURK